MNLKKNLRIGVVMIIALVGLAMLSGVPTADAATKKLKVAFALLWTIDDQGWTTAHYHGIEFLKQRMGDQIEINYTEKVLAADAERVFRNYAQQGYDIIFGTTFEHMDPMLNVAKDYPDIVFEHCSGFKTAANMGNYFARMYQGEYLAGYMAGLMGFKNVGTVATNPIPEPVRGINAFTIWMIKGLSEAGHSFDPEALNTVVWLKAWRDPINETTLAETLVARKHDLIRQMADTPDSSVAACAAGVPAIGYGEDAAWPGSPMTDGADLRPWALAMMREWHESDPVSPKEIERNGTVYFEILLEDAWVWDMYRPARFLSSVRILSFRDVNIEEVEQTPGLRPDAPH